MLCQKDEENKERFIYYLSKIIIDYKARYTLMEKLCYGIVLDTKKLRHYVLYCTTFIFISINPLKYLVAKKHLSGSIAKWLMLL